jgi:hypothetical protein
VTTLNPSTRVARLGLPTGTLLIPVDAVPEREESGLPCGVETPGRVWTVFPNGLFWVETQSRWSALRRRELGEK